MNFQVWSAILSAIINIVLGSFVYFKNKNKLLNVYFSLMCFSMVGWSIGVIGGYTSANQDVALVWCRLLHIPVILVSVFFVYFVFALINLRMTTKFKFLLNILTISFVLNIGNPLFLKNVQKLSFGYYGVPGSIYPLYLAFFVLSSSFGVYKLFQAYKYRSGQDRARIRYVFLAAAIGFSSGFSAFLPLYFGDIPPISNLANLVYVCLIAYAVVRHRLLDIVVILKRTLIFTGLVGFAMLIFGTTTYVVNVLLGHTFGLSRSSITILSVIIVALSSNPMHSFLEKKTDSFLFQRKYDYQKILKDAARGLAQITNLNKLVNLIVHFLTRRMRLSSAGILLLDNSGKRYILFKKRGLGIRVLSILESDILIQFLKKIKAPIVTEDLEQLIESNKKLEQLGFKKTQIEKMYTYLKNTKCSVVVPSIGQEGMNAILMLGTKKSDELYSQSDINTLDALAHDAAIAINNAKAFQDLKIAQQRIAEQDKLAAIGKLAADVSHEIRNPLTVVMGQAEYFLHKNTSSLDEKTRKVLNLVVKHTKRQLDIANRLLKFSRKKESRFEIIHISQPIEEAVEMAKQHMAESKIKLMVDIESGLPNIQGDTNLLHEVFFNLINNSMQAMEDMTGEITVLAELSKTNKEIFVTIADTGPGIPKENLKKIFDPFFTTKEKGTGLGLALCKDYIVRHGGSIEIQSKIGKGTVFLITLPATNEKTFRSIKVVEA